MKKMFLFIALAMISIFAYSQEGVYDLWVPGDESVVSPPVNQNGQRTVMDLPTNPVLYDNGPLITHSGGGNGGADASVLQTNLGMTTYGLGHQIVNNFWIADDFTVPAGGWNIAGFGFYAYQTFSGTISTINDVRLMIYDGPPDDVNSNVVYGDGITNLLTSSTFTNIYRVLDYNMSSTDRPVMLNACMFDTYLAPGTYWVKWQTGGTLSSGPWAPPVTILGQTTTGNALQYTSAWANANDLGTGTQQDFPFLIYGPMQAVPISNWALVIGLGLIFVFTLVRFRKIT
jgi:hypothetical protein